jgi:uncharacterized protein YkwD
MARLCYLAGLLLAGILLPVHAEDSKPKQSAAKETPAAESTTKESGAKEHGTAAKPASAAAKAAAKDEIPLWPFEKKLIELTNAERRRYGLSPLSIERDLLTSTRDHCYWMASARSLQHTTAAVAENIAMGQRSCEEALGSWMASPGHRANILGSYSRLGMAAYQTSDGTIYWCLQFQP